MIPLLYNGIVSSAYVLHPACPYFMWVDPSGDYFGRGSVWHRTAASMVCVVVA